MEEPKNMMQLFEKLNDLKSVFHYGQKIIPIIHSLIDFMSETVPLLENINSSITESTNKIPKASHHIKDVTNATELATTEILDLVDVISEDITHSEQKLKTVSEDLLESQNHLEQLEKYLNGNGEAQKLLILLKESIQRTNEIDSVLSTFEKINNHAYNITISLQVQDITSQQLAAVNHLIQSVQERLSSLIIDLTDKDIKDFKNYEIDVPAGVDFDPNASYNRDSSSQDLVDTLVKKEKNKTSQEEIDKLFS